MPQDQSRDPETELHRKQDVTEVNIEKSTQEVTITGNESKEKERDELYCILRKMREKVNFKWIRTPGSDIRVGEPKSDQDLVNYDFV